MKERHIDVAGHRWFVKLADHPPHPGAAAVVFFPKNNQRPYRVVEVPIARFHSQEALSAASDDDLLGIFRGADPMDFAHEDGATNTHDADLARALPPDVGTSK